MQVISTYFQEFFQSTNKAFFLFCTAFAALLIFFNYKWGIEPKWLNHLPNRPLKFAGFYTLYLLAFGVPYLVYRFLEPGKFSSITIVLILIAPAIFAFKVSVGGWQEALRQAIPGNNGRYLVTVLNWPIRLLLTVSILLLLHYFITGTVSTNLGFLGISTRNFKWWPYILLLICAIPLVAFAAQQPAFLHAYPKLKALRFLAPDGPTLLQKLGYELGYGSDFLTIELFFRGFLVIFFARYIGPAAILPMAVFYCSIHFGKPLLECISSYLGGILLGVIACYSQSILGGIVVHLGLAWMMEIGAILASARILNFTK